MVVVPVSTSTSEMTKRSVLSNGKGSAQRNSPVSRSLTKRPPGSPRTTTILRSSAVPARLGLIQRTASGSGLTTVSMRVRSCTKSWSQSSHGRYW